MAIIKQGVSDPDKVFNFNGLDYKRGNWEIFYGEKRLDSNKEIIKDVVTVGLRSQNDKTYLLQVPIKISDWVDGGGTPYSDLDTLVADISGLIAASAPASSGGGGDATEATLQGVSKEITSQIISSKLTVVENRLAGSERDIEVVEATADGSTDAGVQSVSILFRGNNGSINGVPTRNNFSFSFTPNKGEDTVGSIPFTVPNTGQELVIISYVR